MLKQTLHYERPPPVRIGDSCSQPTPYPTLGL
jgi:hypothetical protein